MHQLGLKTRKRQVKSKKMLQNPAEKREKSSKMRNSDKLDASVRSENKKKASKKQRKSSKMRNSDKLDASVRFESKKNARKKQK